jgi:hypothetical protein
LAAIVVKALDGRGRDGECYLVVGANLTYPDVVRRISRACGRKAYPLRVPAALLAAAGRILERAARKSGRRPLLTAAYGRLSGWTAFYDNAKSRRDFGHAYIDADKTIADGWAYYRDKIRALLHSGRGRAEACRRAGSQGRKMRWGACAVIRALARKMLST